jgi:biotin carboxyl carrier protein
VGKEEFQHASVQLVAARNAESAAESAVQAAREQLAASQAMVDGTSVADHPAVQRAAAKVREAYLALQRVTLLAPADGQVAKRNVQLGQRVQAGTPVMTVVSLKDLWVDANFKESQLQGLRIGQPAELEADVYGTKVVYHGKVVGLGRAPVRPSRCCRPRTPRQLDQGGPARAGAHLAGRQGAGRAPAARGPVDERDGRHRGPVRQAAVGPAPPSRRPPPTSTTPRTGTPTRWSSD